MTTETRPQGDRTAEFVELETEEEWLAAWPVMEPFWPEMDREEFLDYRRRLRDREYQLFALRDDGEPVAAVGVYPDLDVWYGKHVRIRDAVVAADRRSEGFGRELIKHVEDRAREEGYESLVLCSALDRERAHEFYEGQGMERDGYRFVESL